MSAVSSPLRALIWDVDGTLAETERDGHRVAFNVAFEQAGLPWRWDVEHYGELLRVTGGYERLLHRAGARGRPASGRAQHRGGRGRQVARDRPGDVHQPGGAQERYNIVKRASERWPSASG